MQSRFEKLAHTFASIFYYRNKGFYFI